MIAPLVVLLAAGLAVAQPGPSGAVQPAGVPVIAAPAATIDMKVAALLISDQQGGPLPVAVGVGRRLDGDTPSDTPTIDIRVELDGAMLLDALAASTDPLVAEVFVYTIGDRLEVLDAASLTVPLEHQDGPALGATGLRATVSFPARDQATTARVLARVGDAFGLRGVALPATTAAPALLEPRFGGGEAWVTAHPRDQSPGEAVEALPVLAIGEPVEPRFDHLGSPVGAVALRLHREESADSVDLPLKEPLPTMEPGRYTGRLVALDESTEIEPSAEVDLVIVDGSAYAVPWPRLARLGQAPTPTDAGGEILLPDDLRDALDVLERGWLEVLVALPDTGIPAGVDAIRGLEVEARNLFGPQGIRALMRTRNEAFDDLARQLRRDDASPEALLPILALGLELERVHADHGRFSLARRAMDDALTVTRRLAADLDEDDVALRRAVCGALAWIADRLQRRGFVDLAEALFRDAIELDEADSQLRFGLFANLVRHGRPGDAADELARAGLPIDGISSREVTLRRAVAERRAERWADAEGRLRGLLGGPDDWITRVASQEMAYLHLERNRPKQAEEIVRRAMRRLSADPSLQTLLARAQVGQGRQREARATLLAIPPTPALDNPRTRMNAWPTDSLAERRDALFAAAEAQTPTLAGAARRLLETR